MIKVTKAKSTDPWDLSEGAFEDMVALMKDVGP